MMNCFQSCFQFRLAPLQRGVAERLYKLEAELGTLTAKQAGAYTRPLLGSTSASICH